MQKVEKRKPEAGESLQEKKADDKVKQELPLVEASLYVAGRPLDINELCSVLNTRSKNRIRKLVKALIQGYSERNTALEILELKEERYVLQLKSDFTPRVRKLVNRPLLSMGPLKTLSYIAYRQPVSQKRVVDVRGHHAYGHVKVLKEMGLVASERAGRSSVLKTTEYFADYFALSHDPANIKRELRHIFEEGEKQEESSIKG
ncbi:MAG: SMC-Scp complex subunit ScpB [Candidatus Bathyarchaeia archaeon]